MWDRKLNYKELYNKFKWDIPNYYNIGHDICEKWSKKTPKNPAIIDLLPSGKINTTNFEELNIYSNKVANYLKKFGLNKSDRVGILLPQSLECIVSHISVFKIGGISVPLFLLFGPVSLEHRIFDAQIKTVITDERGAKKLRSMRNDIQKELVIFTIEGSINKLNSLTINFSEINVSSNFIGEPTNSEDPALLLYTSGTTGPPKGVLHAHRVLLGHLPAFNFFLDLFSTYKNETYNLLWTPADWAWIGGLLNILFCSLHHGVPVLAYRFEKFDALKAIQLISDFKVTGSFLPPTALKMLRSAIPKKTSKKLYLKSVASGGEPLGTELLDWGRKVLGVNINEIYGQTECNLVLSSCSKIMKPRPGIAGPPVPGNIVSIVNQNGIQCKKGELGAIAIKKGSPQMFLRYWNNNNATKDKYINDWMITGDKGIIEKDNWIRFIARDDDVITSSGYRIGPGPIEDCLMKHPSVSMAAVIGIEDSLRTQIIKAFIVLNKGYIESDNLKLELQSFISEKLSAHEYPREVEVVKKLPTTSTGKILRRNLRNKN
ncbi:MAG: AMP-binding protein [Paracoccaceae bacterium]